MRKISSPSTREISAFTEVTSVALSQPVELGERGQKGLLDQILRIDGIADPA